MNAKINQPNGEGKSNHQPKKDVAAMVVHGNVPDGIVTRPLEKPGGPTGFFYADLVDELINDPTTTEDDRDADKDGNK